MLQDLANAGVLTAEWNCMERIFASATRSSAGVRITPPKVLGKSVPRSPVRDRSNEQLLERTSRRLEQLRAAAGAN